MPELTPVIFQMVSTSGPTSWPRPLPLKFSMLLKVPEIRSGSPSNPVIVLSEVEKVNVSSAEPPTILLKSINIDGQNPYSFFILGNIYAMEYNNPREAISYYKKALYLNPDIEDGYLNIGNTYAMMNNWEEAINSYEKQLSNNPKSASAYINLSLLYKSIGNLKLSRETLERGINLNPHSNSLKDQLRQLEE